MNESHKNRRTEDGGFYFGPARAQDMHLSEHINELIDAALERENDRRTPRDYLGGSRLGVECLRALAYEWHEQREWREQWMLAPANPPSLRKPAVEWTAPYTKFPGRVLRRFYLGHLHEDETADWLRKAGFDLKTRKPDGGQFGFETGKGKIKGHADGVIVGGPLSVSAAYPLLWEHKIMNAKNWKKLAAEGLRDSKPVYYAQIQTYMAYMNLPACLFTAINTNTSELHCEMVMFDAPAAQEATDRGVKVIQSNSPEELPRLGKDETDFRCKFCDYKKRCWAADRVAVADPTQAWGGTLPWLSN